MDLSEYNPESSLFLDLSETLKPKNLSTVEIREFWSPNLKLHTLQLIQLNMTLLWWAQMGYLTSLKTSKSLSSFGTYEIKILKH